MKHITLIGMIFFSVSAFAEEGDGRLWEYHIGLGASFGGQTSYEFKDGPSMIASTQDKGSITPHIEGGIGRELGDFFNLHFLGYFTTYQNQTVKPSDGQMTFILLPKFVYRRGKSTYWSGVGVGITNTRLGYSASMSTNGLTRSNTDISSNSLTIVPRIGYDQDISKNFFWGIEVYYQKIKGSVRFSLSDGISPYEDYTEEFSRSWIGSIIKIGRRF